MWSPRQSSFPTFYFTHRKSQTRFRLGVVMDSEEQGMTSSEMIAAQFAKDSTIHGVSKVASANLYPGRRLFWLLLVLVAVSTLSVLLYLELTHFYDRPTLIKEVYRSANKDDFPTVTFCPLRAFQGTLVDFQVPSYEQDILHNLMHVDSYLAASALTHLHSKLVGRPPSNISSWYTDPVSGRALINWTMSSNVLTPIACPKFKGMNIDSLSCCDDILEKVLTEIGSCYTMNMTKVFENRYQSVKNKRLVAAFSLTLMPDSKGFQANGIQVIVHDQREPPLPTMRGDFVAVNTVTTIRVEKTQRQSLSDPYDSFGTQQCVHSTSPGFADPINRYQHSHYSYAMETCELECLINYTVKACGCRHPWYPGTDNLCSIFDVYSCVGHERGNYNIDNDTNCICPHVCAMTMFTTTITTNMMTTPDFRLPQKSDAHGFDTKHTCADQDLPQWMHHESVIILDVLLPKNVRDLQQVPTKRLLDILSSFGGLLGLFLGLSLLSVVEVAEFIFLLILNVARNSTPKTKDG